MSVAAAIRQMMEAGLTLEQALTAAEVMEAASKPVPPARSAAAERMARYRARRREMGLNPNFHGEIYRAELISRDGDLCVYCQAKAGEAVDHMTPIAQGGTDDIDNLALSCAACNGGKSGRTPEEWGVELASLTARAARVRYVRRVREQSEHVRNSSPPEEPSRVVYTSLPSLRSEELTSEAKASSVDELSKPAPKSKPDIRPPKSRGTRLPDDWEPSEADVEVARREGLTDEEISRAALEFRNFWSARSGSAATKLNWPRTWHNRVLEIGDRKRRYGPRLVASSGKSGGGGRGAVSFADIYARRHGAPAD